MNINIFKIWNYVKLFKKDIRDIDKYFYHFNL